MSVQHSLSWDIRFYEFELGHNTVEATKNIRCVKGDGAFDCRTVAW